MYKFKLTPQKTVRKETEHVKICTDIPSPQTIEIIKEGFKNEPTSMNNQLPIVWDRAIDYQVFDKSGNCWIDFTSTIFVANVGHSNPEVCEAIKKTVDSQLLNSYYYPTKIRQEFVRELLKQCSPNLNKAFLLTTGSESTEAAIKISKKYGRKKGKKYIISYNQSFHGKTMGAQMLGGKPLSKEWIDFQHPHIINVKFPYPWEKITFEDTLEELRELNIPLEEICAFITESYLGWCSCLLPKKYVQDMRAWCDQNEALLVFDEVQSGFGRTGKFFAFEHYDVEADIICCGKGISSSLPLSAVLTSDKIIEPEQSYNSTHGSNPVCCAASLASLKYIINNNLVDEAARKGRIIEKMLLAWKQERPDLIERIVCSGMAASIFITSKSKNNTVFLDKVIEEAMRRGLLCIRSPIGTIKLGPPLTIPDSALVEGLEILKNSVYECEKKEGIR
tara:strand:+ start:4948 stop:6291 length:1344 start_codon:yes stop_codon:yes gene_type:complete